MKQTAVEFLLNYCERENWSIPKHIEELAKKMEKEQIMDAYRFGLSDEYVIGSKRYYDEVCKSEKSNDID